MDHERLAHLIREQAAKTGQRIDTRQSERTAANILRDRDNGAPPPNHEIAARRQREGKE